MEQRNPTIKAEPFEQPHKIRITPDNQMRICYIADAFSIHMQRWVNYFAGRGHDIHFITKRSGKGYSDSVQFHLLNSPIPRFSAISGYINSLSWIIQARQLIKRIKPDIIDGHYITLYGYLAIASGFHPVVLTPWGSDILIMPQKRLHKLLIKFALGKADLIICDSQTLKKGLEKLGTSPTKIRMVYNGVDTQQFSPKPGNEFKAKIGLPGSPTIISTRSLRPLYNIEMLIKAVPLVLKEVPQLMLIIAGEGELRGGLENLAKSLKVANNIRFVGWVSHEKLANYLASSDIYVSTSLSDSTSISLQEAMACELAPVVTDLPANREWVINGGNGFIVPVNNIDMLAERIIYLLKNDEVRKKFGKAGRKIIIERAEYKKEMQRMESFYQELVGK